MEGQEGRRCFVTSSASVVLMGSRVRAQTHSHSEVRLPGNFQRLHRAGVGPQSCPSQHRGTFVPVAQQPSQPLEQERLGDSESHWGCKENVM
ncbi:hypothetical protein INR49_032614 [Caranx melampygus]|nr:hypothetical protein INR49_032614 [Caranx melampygus]